MKKKQKLNREWTRMNAKLVTGCLRSMWPSSATGFGQSFEARINTGRMSGF
jgi:hypothetical protein